VGCTDFYLSAAGQEEGVAVTLGGAVVHLRLSDYGTKIQGME